METKALRWALACNNTHGVIAKLRGHAQLQQAHFDFGNQANDVGLSMIMTRKTSCNNGQKALGGCVTEGISKLESWYCLVAKIWGQCLTITDYCQLSATVPKQSWSLDI